MLLDLFEHNFGKPQTFGHRPLKCVLLGLHYVAWFLNQYRGLFRVLQALQGPQRVFLALQEATHQQKVVTRP
jgi:hypothetical protein